MLADEPRRERHEGDHAQQHEIDHRQAFVRSLDGPELPPVRHPVQADRREAQHPGEDPGHRVAQRRRDLVAGRVVGKVGDPQLEDEQRDRDREDRVREEHDPLEIELGLVVGERGDVSSVG
jgi:hypothetical protein